MILNWIVTKVYRLKPSFLLNCPIFCECGYFKLMTIKSSQFNFPNTARPPCAQLFLYLKRDITRILQAGLLKVIYYRNSLSIIPIMQLVILYYLLLLLSLHHSPPRVTTKAVIRASFWALVVTLNPFIITPNSYNPFMDRGGFWAIVN